MPRRGLSPYKFLSRACLRGNCANFSYPSPPETSIAKAEEKRELHSCASDVRPFSFLALPGEVRLMIYSYLVPTTRSEMWCGQPRRHDGPSYPAILYLNRSIQGEVLAQWFRYSVIYEADLSNNGIHFLGRRFSLYKPLPPMLGMVTTLCLRIQLDWRPKKQRVFEERLAECFGTKGALQNLQVYLAILHPLFAGMKSTADEIESALDRALSPLKVIEGLANAMMDLQIEVPKGYFLGGVGAPAPAAVWGRTMSQIHEIVRKYFHNFNTEISEFSIKCAERWVDERYLRTRELTVDL